MFSTIYVKKQKMKSAILESHGVATRPFVQGVVSSFTAQCSLGNFSMKQALGRNDADNINLKVILILLCLIPIVLRVGWIGFAKKPFS